MEPSEADGAVAVRASRAEERIQSLRNAMPEILPKTDDPAEHITGEAISGLLPERDMPEIRFMFRTVGLSEWRFCLPRLGQGRA
jgi:hypothetical protein